MRDWSGVEAPSPLAGMLPRNQGQLSLWEVTEMPKTFTLQGRKLKKSLSFGFPTCWAPQHH